MWINEKYTKDLGWDAINKYLAAGGTLEVSTGLQGYLEEVANNEETLAKQEFGEFKGILRDYQTRPCSNYHRERRRLLRGRWWGMR